jgi:hypothetical protein
VAAVEEEEVVLKLCGTLSALVVEEEGVVVAVEVGWRVASAAGMPR